MTAVLTSASVQPLAALADAIIDNGVVQLGINDEGHLNVQGGTPSLQGTTAVGLRYLPTNAESTAPGCLCEGWGVADLNTGVAGFANEAVDGVQNLEVLSFSATADRAESIVQIKDGTGMPVIKVRHSYLPSPRTRNLYVVTVRIENIGTTTIKPAYRRVMDWDIEPTAFNEYSTIATGTAKNITFTSNNGFASANPLAGPSSIGFTGNFTDAGPADHGALFDFQFDDLPPGTAREFTTYYGAAGSEADALAALATVEAEAYSFGQPTTDADGNPTSSADARPDLGRPNTFIFAFGGVGGTPLFVPSSLTLSPKTGTLRINKEYCLNGMVLDQFGKPFTGAPIHFVRTGANPGDDLEVSDASGSVKLCWTGTHAGQDQILASVRDLRDTATVEWTDRRVTDVAAGPVIALSLKRSEGRVPLSPQARLTERVSGAPVAGKTLVFEAANQRLCEAKTNAMGLASCTGYLRSPGSLLPVLRETGYVARFAGDDDFFGAEGQAKLLGR